MTRVWLCGSAKGKITEERIQRSLCTDFSSLLCNCVYCCHQLSSLTTNTRQDTTKRRRKNLLLVRLWNKTMIHHFVFSRLWDPCTTIEGHGLPVCVCVHASDVATLPFCCLKQHTSTVKWLRLKTNSLLCPPTRVYQMIPPMKKKTTNTRHRCTHKVLNNMGLAKHCVP